MADVLPPESGLTVNGLTYRYTTIKKEQDDMLVNIQNQNALGTGLIFKNQDDWSGLPGNTIVKSVPINNIPIQYWGAGEISVEGAGEVSNPVIIYSYRYDTCFDPINDPNCPGYAQAMADFLDKYGLLNVKTEIKDPLDDENVKNALNNKAKNEDEESLEDKKKKEEEKKKEKKKSLAIAENVLAKAADISQTALLEAMNSVPQFNSYYSSNIPGGTYADVNQYKPTTIPENKKALRVGFAQQILHNKMVDSQYSK